jgi:hypothetical protein
VSIVAGFGHRVKRLVPTLPRRFRRSDDDSLVLDFKLNLTVETGLVEQGLRNPKPLGVADANDVSFHGVAPCRVITR